MGPRRGMTMADSKPGFSARCGSCDKGYRVPTQGKIYPCKLCGGEVLAAAELTEEDELQESPPPSRSDKRERRSAEKAEEREAVLQLRKADKAFKAARVLYGFAAFVNLAIAGVLWVGNRAANRDGVLNGQVMTPELQSAAYLALALVLIVGAIFLLGAIYVRRYPFPSSLTVACLVTLGQGWLLISAFGEMSKLGKGLSVLLISMVWGIVTRAMPVRDILEKHGDTYAAQRYSGQRTRGGIMRSGPTGPGWIPGVVVVLAVVALLSTAGKAEARPSIEPSLDAFMEYWQEGDLEAFQEVVPNARAIKRCFELQGEWGTWAEAPPETLEMKSTEILGGNSNRLLNTWVTDQGERVELEWKLVNGVWDVESCEVR